METLRLQLGNAFSSCVSVSSTQLYGVIVGLTVFGCWGILSLAESPELPELTTTARGRTTVVKQQQKTEGPEPRWHLFRWVNMLVVVAFACSVAEFSLNATAYWNDSNVLCKFLIGWSLLLCYFFGFFGIMFIHDLEDAESTASHVTAPVSKR